MPRKRLFDIVTNRLVLLVFITHIKCFLMARKCFLDLVTKLQQKYSTWHENFFLAVRNNFLLQEKKNCG